LIYLAHSGKSIRRNTYQEVASGDHSLVSLLAAGNALGAVRLSVTADVEVATDGVDRLKVDGRTGPSGHNAEGDIRALGLLSLLAGQGGDERHERKKGRNLHVEKRVEVIA
jgi:hypothetical protein